MILTSVIGQGEEIAIGIRGFTYGYDFYAPRDSVVFHEYAVKSSRRKKVHMFWCVSTPLISLLVTCLLANIITPVDYVY